MSIIYAKRNSSIVVAIKDMLNILFKFVGPGETPEDITEFVPDEFVEALFN